MKEGNATGKDGISVELITALEEFRVEHIHRLLNKIYNTGHVSEDMIKSISIVLTALAGITLI